MIAIFSLAAGPQWLGLLTAATWLPWLVIGIPAGVIVDRSSPRTVMIIANLVTMAALATVPVAALVDRLSLPQLVLVALVTGCCIVFFRSAYPGLVATLVPPGHLESANSRLYGSQSTAEMAGPGIAGAITQLGSAALGMLAQLIGLAASTVCLVALSRVERHVIHEPGSVRRRVADGFGSVFGDPVLRNMTVAGGMANFGLTGIMTVLLLFLTAELGLPPGGAGAVLTVGMAGGIAGAAAAPALSRILGSARLLRTTQALQPVVVLVPLAGAGAAGWAVVTAAWFALAFVTVGGNVVRSSWLQRYVQPGLLARSITVSQLINYGTMPLAALVSGALGANLGLRPTMLIMVGAVLVAAIWLNSGPLRGRRALPNARTAPHRAAAAEPRPSN
ncbi:putative MFS family arabinose efflux permease [Naumannella cuiyingiana]|uniref:Putative MFS family arabinose efflux permease n=2 Tax=Naumannella cuiyingiana TaxID=1347891 RepID=A0A7Z0D9V9_9ACTN|nr:putative MFS family arabinose efflux permease [Naumannella cuiyingiana]